MKQKPLPGVSKRVVYKTSDNDRAWFEARPERNYRARPWVKGESPPFDWGKGNPYTVVRQVQPGMRMRVFLGCGGAPLEMAPEDVLEEIWAHMTTNSKLEGLK